MEAQLFEKCNCGKPKCASRQSTADVLFHKVCFTREKNNSRKLRKNQEKSKTPISFKKQNKTCFQRCTHRSHVWLPWRACVRPLGSPRRGYPLTSPSPGYVWNMIHRAIGLGQWIEPTMMSRFFYLFEIMFLRTS